MVGPWRIAVYPPLIEVVRAISRIGTVRPTGRVFGAAAFSSHSADHDDLAGTSACESAATSGCERQSAVIVMDQASPCIKCQAEQGSGELRGDSHGHS